MILAFTIFLVALLAWPAMARAETTGLVWSTGDLEYGVHVTTITFPENGEEVDPINIDALDAWGKLLEVE